MSNVEDISQIKLNTDQQDAVEQMVDFATGPNMFFRLDGAAGTGKSTTAAFACKELVSQGVQLALAAPTNKATRNLATFKHKVDPNANITTGTIYSLLGLVLGNDGEVRQVQNTEMHKMEGVQLCVLDEAYMTNTNLMGCIHDFSLDTGTKFIFMGDPYQLPPVGEDQSPVERLHCNARLTKVERHDNQILKLAIYLRECIDNGTRPRFSGDNDSDGGVWVMKTKDFRAMQKRAYASDVYDEYPDAFKTLAWRNAIVDEYNESIRDAMYNGAPADPFEIGERIVCKAPVLDLLKFKAEGKPSFIATTDEEGTVEAIHSCPHPVFGEIPCWNVIFTSSLGKTVSAYMPTRAGQRMYQERANKLADEAKKDRKRWPAFWQFKELFADLAPCHALTTHRGQGSTYRTTFIDLDDMMVSYGRNPHEALRMIYTACTRPSKSLFLKLN